MWWNGSVVAMQTVGSAVLILLELSFFLRSSIAGSLLKCRYRCGSHSLNCHKKYLAFRCHSRFDC